MAGIGFHRDGESRVGRHLECLSCDMSIDFFRAIENDFADSLDDLHAFGLASSEVKGTGKNDPDGLVFTLFSDDRVRDDLALEVDIGFGVNGGVIEFHTALIGFRGIFCKCKPYDFSFMIPVHEIVATDSHFMSRRAPAPC